MAEASNFTSQLKRLGRWIAGIPDPNPVPKVPPPDVDRVEQCETVSELTRFLADPHPVIREAALMRMVSLDAYVAGQALLAALAGDEDEWVRLRAARRLGQLRYPAAGPALAGSLDDTDPSVAAAAARALGGFSDPDSRAALIRAMDPGNEAPLRYAAASALEERGDLRRRSVSLGISWEKAWAAGVTLVVVGIALGGGDPQNPLLIGGVVSGFVMGLFAYYLAQRERAHKGGWFESGPGGDGGWGDDRATWIPMHDHHGGGHWWDFGGVDGGGGHGGGGDGGGGGGH